MRPRSVKPKAAAGLLVALVSAAAGGQSGVDKGGEFDVQAQPVRGQRVNDVGAGEDRHASLV
jgi:fructose-1-phosphate kinase PfkB-like protein